jgi:hypothetical protein
MQTKPVETIRYNTMVRRIIGGREGIATYRRGEYDCSTRLYTLHAEDDISRTISIKRGTQLSVGFTY